MVLHARFLPFLPVWLACAALALVPAAHAQEGATDPAVLEELVGPVALYPDDLLSILLPSSTYPLQIVEADRWVKANKGNKDAKPKDAWDDSVKALINYPDVIQKMNDDLEWTAALGEAVVADQTAVMDAVQSFRRKANGAGNLKTDEKQTVVVEEEVVKIVQTDPQVIYVPQYEPATVVVQQSVPYSYPYYPTAYPCYYCTYPPGYAFASGFFWGAATAYAFNWFGGGIHGDIDIDIDRNVNRDSNRNVDRSRDSNRASDRATNIDRGRSNEMRNNKQGTWKSQARAGDVSRGRQPGASDRMASSQRMGDRPSAGTSNRAGAGASNRAGAGASNRAGSGASASNRAAGSAGSRQSGSVGSANRSGAASRGGSSGAISLPSSMQGNRSSSSYGGSRGSYGGSGSYGNASRYSGSARSSSPSRSAYSGMSSGRSSGAYSSRGSSSRGSMGGGGGRGGGGGGRRR